MNVNGRDRGSLFCCCGGAEAGKSTSGRPLQQRSWFHGIKRESIGLQYRLSGVNKHISRKGQARIGAELTP